MCEDVGAEHRDQCVEWSVQTTEYVGGTAVLHTELP